MIKLLAHQPVLSILFTTCLAINCAHAQDTWHIGPTISHYDLDAERSVSDDQNSVLGGLQIGRRVAQNVDLELGYAKHIGHDDFDVLTLNGLFWMGDIADGWAPFALLGLNQYDFKDSSNLVPSHSDKSIQVLFGLGVGKRIAQHYDVRADMRLLGGHSESGEDLGFQLSVNRVFGGVAPRTVQVPEKPEVIPEPIEILAKEPRERTVTVRLNVEFQFDKAEVIKVRDDELEIIATSMRAHPAVTLILEGHTDSMGKAEYNLDLSLRRAEAVKEKLTQDYGIASERISAKGFGESYPIDTNETSQGRAENRRVIGELTYTEILVE